MKRIFMMSRASSCWPYAIFFSRNKIEKKKNFWPKQKEVFVGFFFFCGNQYIYINLISMCGRKKTNKSNTYNHKLFPRDQVISWMQALKSCPKKNIYLKKEPLCVRAAPRRCNLHEISLTEIFIELPRILIWK